MKRQINVGRITLVLGAIAVGLALSTARLTQPVKADAEKNALSVQAEASQGSAEPGNTLPANFLVIVTDESGAPVVGLVQSDFQIINHFRLPEQTCGFSNRISSFHDTHNGAYQIQVDLNPAIPGCAWVQGDYLAQIAVSDSPKRGQAAAKLSVRN
jgi:hypothetical protein